MTLPSRVEHSPLPWKKSQVTFEKSEWDELYNEDQICISKGMDILAIVYGPNDQEKANALFIETACNAYEANQKAIRVAVEALKNIKRDYMEGCECVVYVVEALERIREIQEGI